jgi:hypothetical protein
MPRDCVSLFRSQELSPHKLCPIQGEVTVVPYTFISPDELRTRDLSERRQIFPLLGDTFVAKSEIVHGTCATLYFSRCVPGTDADTEVIRGS